MNKILSFLLVVLPMLAQLSAQTTIERRVAAGSDDAEQSTSSSGSMDLTSSDLDLGEHICGLRFTGLNIPQGATITNAYIQFISKTSDSGTTSVTIKAQAADNAGTFTTTAANISGRATGSASVSWSIPTWTSSSLAGADQRTPNLAAVVQQVVGRSGWASGNAMVFVITGTGRRQAKVFENGSTSGALLHIVYTTASTTPSLTVSPSSLSFGASASSQSIAVTSNVSWTSSDNQSWITVSPTSGSNNGTVSVSLTANTSSSSRSGTVTITGGGITRTVTVTQSGASTTPSLTVSPSSLSFGASASSQSIAVTSNVSWTSSDNQSWITVSPTSGSNNGTVSVSLTANTSSSSRSGTVTITGGGITRTVTVTQSGASGGSGGGTSLNWTAVNNCTNPGSNFAYRCNNTFKVGSTDYRFIGTNMPNIIRLSGSESIRTDAIYIQLKEAARMGARVVRVWISNDQWDANLIRDRLNEVFSIAEALETELNLTAGKDKFRFILSLVNYQNESGNIVSGDNDCYEGSSERIMRPIWISNGNVCTISGNCNQSPCSGGYRTRYIQNHLIPLANSFGSNWRVFAWELGNEIRVTTDEEEEQLLKFLYHAGHELKNRVSQMITPGFMSVRQAFGNRGSADASYNPDATLKALLQKVYHQATADFNGDGQNETMSSPFSFVSIHGYDGDFTDGKRYAELKWASNPGSGIPALPSAVTEMGFTSSSRNSSTSNLLSTIFDTYGCDGAMQWMPSILDFNRSLISTNESKSMYFYKLGSGTVFTDYNDLFSTFKAKAQLFGTGGTGNSVAFTADFDKSAQGAISSSYNEQDWVNVNRKAAGAKWLQQLYEYSHGDGSSEIDSYNWSKETVSGNSYIKYSSAENRSVSIKGLVNLAGFSSPQLSFSYYLSSSSSSMTVQVLSNSPGASWTTLSTISSPSGSWQTRTLSLTGYSGLIRLRITGQTFNNSYVYLDNLSVANNNTPPPPTAFLTVPTSPLNFGAGAGNQSFSVNSNVTWSVSENVDWISGVSPLTGSNNGNVTVSVAANTGTASRSGIITVVGGGISKSVTVNQSGFASSLAVDRVNLQFSSSGGSETITISGNECWTIYAVPSWVNLSTYSSCQSSQQVVVSVGASSIPRGQDYFEVRGWTTNNTVRVYVTQSGAPPPCSIYANNWAPNDPVTNTYLFPTAGRTHTFSIVSNGNWNVAGSTLSALQSIGGTISPQSGSSGTTNVSLTIPANTNSVSRSGWINLDNSNGSGCGIGLAWSQYAAPHFTLQNTLPEYPFCGATNTQFFYTNATWTISRAQPSWNPNWMSVSPVSGGQGLGGTQSLQVSLGVNASGTSPYVPYVNYFVINYYTDPADVRTLSVPVVQNSYFSMCSNLMGNSQLPDLSPPYLENLVMQESHENETMKSDGNNNDSSLNLGYSYNLALMPNPSHGPFSLAYSSDIAGTAMLHIYDMNGARRLFRSLECSAGANTSTMKEGLPSGMYVVILQLPQGEVLSAILLISH